MFIAQECWNEQQMKAKLASSTWAKAGHGASTGQNVICMSTDKQCSALLLVVYDL